jgi:hypothetical protein
MTSAIDFLLVSSVDCSSVDCGTESSGSVCLSAN